MIDIDSIEALHAKAMLTLPQPKPPGVEPGEILGEANDFDYDAIATIYNAAPALIRIARAVKAWGEARQREAELRAKRFVETDCEQLYFAEYTDAHVASMHERDRTALVASAIADELARKP